jgi:hypothetical protein
MHPSSHSSFPFENFNIAGKFEKRANGCAFRRKYKPINVLHERQPGNLYIPSQQFADLSTLP